MMRVKQGALKQAVTFFLWNHKQRSESSDCLPFFHKKCSGKHIKPRGEGLATDHILFHLVRIKHEGPSKYSMLWYEIHSLRSV